MLGAEHLVSLLPVCESELVRERVARLGTGRVAPESLRPADRQLSVAGDVGGAGEVEVLHTLLQWGGTCFNHCHRPFSDSITLES